jgi:hypothetical protein
MHPVPHTRLKAGTPQGERHLIDALSEHGVLPVYVPANDAAAGPYSGETPQECLPSPPLDVLTAEAVTK